MAVLYFVREHPGLSDTMHSPSSLIMMWLKPAGARFDGTIAASAQALAPSLRGSLNWLKSTSRATCSPSQQAYVSEPLCPYRLRGLPVEKTVNFTCEPSA